MTTSGQSLTFIIGTGPNVSLNGLVGHPWIQKVGAVFDPMDEVIECKLSDVAPFPVTSMRAQFSVPAVSTSLASTPPAYQAFYSDLVNLEREIKSSGCPLQPSSRSVHFAVDREPADSRSAVDISDPNCPIHLGQLANDSLEHYQIPTDRVEADDND